MKIMKSDRLEGQLKEDKENSEIDGESMDVLER